jgi:signal transduction histidine kinase
MSIFAVPSLLASIFAFGLGLFVISKQYSSPTNRIFGLLCLETFHWQACWFLSYFLMGPIEKDLIIRIAFSVIIFIPFTYYHFAVLFLKLPTKKNYIYVGYLFGLIFLVLLWNSKLFIEGFRDFWWGYYPKEGVLFSVYLIVVFFFITRALVLIFKAMREKGPSVDQNKIRFMALAHFIYYFAAIEYAIDYGVPLYPIGVFFFIASWLVIAYAITKEEIMDIRVAISRTAAYGVIGILMVTSFALLNLIKMPQFIVFLSNTTLSLLWAWTAHHLRELIQTPLVDKWITDWYDPDKLLNSIALKLVPVLERKEAFEIVANELKNIIKIKNVEILIGDQASKTGEIKRVGKTMEIPFSSTEGVEGVIKLGEKTSEDPYDEKDLRLFQTLQVQLLAILDRIRPYEAIKRDFEANEKKLYMAEAQLERSSRLASLGTLTAGITHEIRNPLSVIRTETDRLADKERDLNYLKEHRELVLSQAMRIDNIVNRTLGLARGEKSGMTAVNLNNIIESSLRFIPINPGIEVKKELNEIPHFNGNPEELQEVFNNLIQNAIQAMPQGGILTLRTYLKDKQVVAEVSDTGKGIPEEIQNKVFDPFFSTRHEGAGLGLSIVFHIMQHHGGTIQLESKEGKGTTFRATFPLSS